MAERHVRDGRGRMERGEAAVVGAVQTELVFASANLFVEVGLPRKILGALLRFQLVQPVM